MQNFKLHVQFLNSEVSKVGSDSISIATEIFERGFTSHNYNCLFIVYLPCLRIAFLITLLVIFHTAVYGIFFADNTEGAFSTYRFYESIGMVIGYGLNSVLCVKHKLYVLIGLFVLGVIGYYITERRQYLRDEERRKMAANKPRRRSEILVESFLATSGE